MIFKDLSSMDWYKNWSWMIYLAWIDPRIDLEKFIQHGLIQELILKDLSSLDWSTSINLDLDKCISNGLDCIQCLIFHTWFRQIFILVFYSINSSISYLTVYLSNLTSINPFLALFLSIQLHVYPFIPSSLPIYLTSCLSILS